MRDDTSVAEIANSASGHAHLIAHDTERMVGQRANPVRVRYQAVVKGDVFSLQKKAVVVALRHDNVLQGDVLAVACASFNCDIKLLTPNVSTNFNMLNGSFANKKKRKKKQKRNKKEKQEK